MATDRSELSEQIDACILSLARLAVEVQRGTAGDDAAETMRELTEALEKYRAKQAKPEHDWLTDRAVKDLTEVYRGVRKAKVTSPEYDRRLRAALAPFGIIPSRKELRALALSPRQISDASNGEGRHTGPKEAAKRALAPHIDNMLTWRRRHPVTGERSDGAKAMLPLLVNGPVGTTTLQNRQTAAKNRGDLDPVVTLADARAYLAELAQDDVERARRSTK